MDRCLLLPTCLSATATAGTSPTANRNGKPPHLSERASLAHSAGRWNLWRVYSEGDNCDDRLMRSPRRLMPHPSAGQEDVGRNAEFAVKPLHHRKAEASPMIQHL